LFYKKGIIKRFCGIFPDHAALVVGYGSEDGTDYWLLKNSWGTKWGEKGYFRIMKEMDKDYEGLCGIQEMPSYPSF
jgi:KDEL-tailed cysteine endopeptidase